MATRSTECATRLLGIEAVGQLVERLQEEYLMLLPEAIPFLAELLEDPESSVEASSRRVLKRLEDLAQEPLDQYLKV